MRKVLAYVGILFSCMLLGVLIISRWTPLKEGPAVVGHSEALIKKYFNIACLYPDNDLFCQEAAEGLRQGVYELADAQFEVNEFPVVDRIRLTAAVDEILSRKCDMIVTIGAEFTRITQSILKRRKKKIPLVFLAVLDPAKLGIVDKEDRPGGFTTGITLDNYSWSSIGNIFFTIKPHMKKALFPWDPAGNGGTMEENVDLVADILRQKGVDIVKVPIEHVSEAVDKVKSLCAHVDTVIILAGGCMYSAMKGIARQCSRHGVTLMVLDLNAPDEGAAIGYGVYTRDLGRAAVRFIDRILVKKENPSIVPVLRMKDYARLAVNVGVMKEQGLRLTPAQLFLIDKGMLVNKVKDAA